MTLPTRLTRRTALQAGAAVIGMSVGGAANAAGKVMAAIPETEGYAPVRGGRIYWRKFGSGPNTPLLLVHGGPGAAHNYLLTMKALADERPVIFYDQLGCGKADAPTDEALYSIQRSVDELDAVRAALGLHEVVLYGHSWGTLLAIEYLCQGRGKGVEKLILGGAVASIPQAVAGFHRLIDGLPDGFAAKLHGLEAAGKMGSPEYAALVQTFYDIYLLRVAPTPDALVSFDALAKSISYRVLNGPNEFTITGVMKDWDRRRDLKAIRPPTLIITGEFDEITLDCHQTIRDGVAGPSQLVVMPGCSHMTMVEKPDQHNGLVRSFLAKG